MLGKGSKRKLDEDEEGLEGKALAAGAGAMTDGLSKVSYTLQRQTIFNMSLMKLYNQRALTEPSLEKRVLINNMLRRIQDELKQEGNLRPLFFPPSPPPDDPVDESFREAQPAFSVLSMVAPPLSQSPALSAPVLMSPSPGLSNPAPLEACLTPASLLEEDSVTLCISHTPLASPPLPRLPPSVARDSFSSALDEIEELCPSPLPPTTAVPGATSPPSSPTVALHMPLLPPTLNSGDSKDCCKPCSPKLEGLVPLPEEQPAVPNAPSRLLESLPPNSLDMNTSPTSSSSGFLTDLALDDILFADIDTSMYDFDPCTSSSGAVSSKLAPMVTADELLKTLSPYSGATPAVTSNQPFKMDLTELDHIMEVLVGS
ncbi:SERTA domain-containing protein 2b [Myxocyprinus asiaticus]|uniref:SERTA domain-containing protein 2b n=1 Tax=Myxocyprinus asiaticus TaxID=70543 RepID=UPI002221740D|nr:SERTA domain-containing protein 2b [Myxocyprinus asiaticus]XP_051507644.1 SERTA domain-containing protein 2b [Myxocyprinus asiaticus]XP_051507645.1 SERTA domain-containing protein 2b [Myxocyprinus asiaticus]XP_051507646.1 SERTA domain-containing protein 2b [Myxocyprinus asiaticus]XP_051507647.1 SERTA domain-containing protein 2b [Myxocyprinus asiaticus]XP_051507649.1 SERTA domain-containing protein 2b [Myxocyprinus asiaticus]XP_051507650.1 SERTA domain-containing protein 2b [Myxocyprinus a